MNHWKVLGIDATRDKRVIKLTYTELLKQYPPAEFPEEFKNIRKAYELATKEAKKPLVVESDSTEDTDSVSEFEQQLSNVNIAADIEPKGIVDKVFFDEDEPTSPVVEEEEVAPQPIELHSVSSLSQLNIALHQLYTNVSLRLDIDQWKKLFSAPIFWDVDQNKQVSLLLVSFLSENRLLSRSVYDFLDENVKISSALVLSKDLQCRELAIGVKHFIDSLPKRIHYKENYDDSIDFDLLQAHLQLRYMIEEQCIYNNVTAQQLMALMAKVDPHFYDDDLLYLYVTSNLWALEAYEEIKQLLTCCSIKDSLSQVGDYQAHAEYMLGNYDTALVLYTTQRERQKNFYGHWMSREIGLCHLHLKHYQQAHVYLTAATYIKEADIDSKAALITARRGYINVLKQDEATNAIEIARLQFENGRYQDALLITQTYRQIFEEECNYLQALCLVKLGRLEEAFVEFEKFLSLYESQSQLMWPLLVDLVTSCPNSITFDFLVKVLVPKLPSSPQAFYKTAFYPGSIHPRVYSPYELETLDLPPVNYDGEPNKPMSSVVCTEIDYKQYYCWGLIHALLVKLVEFAPEMKKNLKGVARQSIKHVMTKVPHDPSMGLKFIQLMFEDDDFTTCIKLAEYAIGAFPNSARLYYYKGRSLAALEQYQEAISPLMIAADKFGHEKFGVRSLEYAIECCEKLVALGEPEHPKYQALCVQLQTAKEVVDAQSK
mgnify:CR=1 FL=1